MQYHRLVRSRIYLNLKRERVKLIQKKQANIGAVRVKADQFMLVLANKCAALEKDDENELELIKETATRLLSEAAIEVEGKTTKKTVVKLPRQQNT